MSDIVTLPFPLFDDTDRYRSVGVAFGDGASMLMAMADLFPVVRPWKECVVHFEEPRSPFKAPLRVTVSDASVAQARTNAAHTQPRSPEIKPAWEEPAAETVDGMVRRVYSDDELATIARWQGAYSQIKYDAGPFWLKRGRYFGLEERKQHSWRHSDSTKWPETLRRATYTNPTEADLIFAFSRMLYRSAEINKKVEMCDAKGKVCRSYQAADLFRVYYLAGRRISTTDIICADLVIEAIQGHLRRDGKITWEARTAILDMLEGASDRAAAQKHGIHHRSAQDRYTTEALGIEAKFGRYCRKYEPRQKQPTGCYNRGVGRRKSAKPHTWRMSRAKRRQLVGHYLKEAKTAFTWLDDNFIAYLRIMYRGGALRIIIKYLNLRALPHKAYQLIADYLERGGKILKAGAAYSGGTAPYRTDKRSKEQVIADRFGEPAGPDPFELFDQPKPQRLRDDVEYGVDEKIAGTPFFE